jgi:uncharacterized metal-binding protein
MPDGKNHNIINITVLLLIISGFYSLFTRADIILPIEYLNFQIISVFSISYLFGTFFLSPDLDIRSSPYERWGIFRFLWWPYKFMFKHRGLSHHFIFGPLTILANFTLILMPVLVLAEFNIYRVPVEFITAVVLGIWVSIELHIMADMVVSEIY